MIYIDFNNYIGHTLFDDISYFIKERYQLITQLKSFKRLIEIKFTEIDNRIENSIIENRELEIISLKINSDENLFYYLYKNYESLLNFSDEEKISFTIDIFFELLTQTSLSSFDKSKVRKVFLQDYIEFKKFIISHEPQNKQNSINSKNEIEKFSDLESLIISKNFTIEHFKSLKNFDIIYKKNDVENSLKENYKSDFVLLMLLLNNHKIIKLESQKAITKYFKEIFNESISASYVNNLNKKLLTDCKDSSDAIITSWTNINNFINHFKN